MLRIQKRKRRLRDGTISISWRLIVLEYQGGDYVSHYPPKRHYFRYGLDSDDSLEKAKEKLEVVRAKNRIDRVEEKRAKVEKKIAKIDLKQSAYLPKGLYADFLRWLKTRRLWDDLPKKEVSHLRCMRRMVLDLDICPSTWPQDPGKVYGWFKTKKLSLSYIEKILPLLNEYGYFYCAEMKKPFMPLRAPWGDIARRIEDSNLEWRNGKQSASKPTNPAHLHKLEHWPDDNLRWMRLSIFFGFRPSEIDDLTEKNRNRVWHIAQDIHGTYVLHFYQRKLIRIERERRWKRIPCILPEQITLIMELEKDLPIKRPYTHYLKKHLGEGFGLYGGRKNFEKMMREKGQDFRNISRWLGHQDVNRTEKNYREMEIVEYSPVPGEPLNQLTLDMNRSSSRTSKNTRPSP